MDNKIILDVIPIYIGEIYPTKEMIFHYECEVKEGIDVKYFKRGIIEEIKKKFDSYNTVIILEKGIVIEVIK